MPIVTILTPTYNRGHLLSHLHDSLLAQSCADWVWLIVDDGSSDGTQSIVEAWVTADPDRIRYIHKENGGKHTALNVGIAAVTTPVVCIVDSDDTLLPNAVSTIADYYERYESMREAEHLCGFSFLRVSADGVVNGGEYPEDNVIASYVDARVNVGDIGDKAEVFYTDILRRYPFPELSGERFLPEDVVWIRMAEDYNLVHANRQIYVCDYLEGGLTKSGRAMKIHSPLGMMLRSAVYLNGTFHKNLKVKVKMTLLYEIYRQFAERQYGIHTDAAFAERGVPACRLGVLGALLAPASQILYRRWSATYGGQD